ncbi:hypothetical protein ACFQPA_11855 [Halomarina halobia]|uniref:Glycoside hydrolase family 42 N-terminal domain-containing protein n=1 Tax=Halomarina halobia TaxID=3033386 RepID=A0ABD6AA22_9EURY|nr:hypothetical protein [Halomarina sp. PSR21]
MADGEDGGVSRRRMLIGAGGVLGASVASGYAAYRWADDRPSMDGWADVPYPDAGPAESRTDFLWAESPLWSDERLRRNMYAFARQHDLAVVLAAAAAQLDGGKRVAPALRQARETGLEAWVNVGVLKRIDAETFATNPRERQRHLDGLRAVAERYREFAPGGKLVIWQEAPVGGEWIPGGAWNSRSVDNLSKYGPDIFTAQRRAIKGVSEDLDVGIFLHFPYVIESRQPEVFAGLMDDLRSRDAMPDFVFTDFYRGWYEKDAGPEVANDAVRSLIANSRRYSGDRPVYYLGESHTIDPQYTPSKQAMRLDLRASVGAGADGVGWYARTQYTPTKLGFDPFVPNRADPGSLDDGLPADTITVARDRYFYAWAATFARDPAYAPDRRFDLWLDGRDAGFMEYGLWLDGGDGWEFVGDFGGYHPQAQPHVDPDGRHASVFRALDAERFLDGGPLRVRIEPRGDGGARLDRVVAVPFDLGAYCTEREATRLLAEADLEPYSRVFDRETRRLDGETEFELAVRSDAPEPLDELVAPAVSGVRRAVARAERGDSFDAGAYVDLWLRGRGLGDLDAETAADRLLDGLPPAGVASTDRAALLFGVERDRFFADGRAKAMRALLDRGDGEPGIEVAYALPYFGSGNLPAPSHAARLMDRQHGEVANFSVVWQER